MNKSEIKISASIMCIDWLNAGAELKVLEKNHIDYLHWDVSDGLFVPDFIMGSSIINRFRENSTLSSDYHLMAEEPSRLFDTFQINPGDIFTIHLESSRNLHRDLISIRRKGARVGVALCPATSLESMEYIIDDTDVILLMTVNPGFMGQKLVPQMIRKVEQLRRLITDLSLETKIEVDGNVNTGNVPDLVAAGADIIVGGSSGLFRKDMQLNSAIRYLRDSIELGLERRGDP